MRLRDARPVLRLICAASLATLFMVFSAGCGGEGKSVPAGDQAAIDRFTDAARQWTNRGANPWYAAFKSANPAKLSAVAPSAQSAMAASIGAMQKAASEVKTPAVRESLNQLVDSYRAKLKAIRQIDAASASGSVSGINEGVVSLKEAGAAAASALKAYAKSAKQQWGSDPLSDFKIG